MTTKQVARKFYMGWKTLEHFLQKGWVDPPANLDDWTAEILRGYIQARTCIAYRRGWRACRKGVPIDQHDGSII